MSDKASPKKSSFHPKNKHIEGYNFEQLVKANPALQKFVIQTKYGHNSIDFFNPLAVKALNKALLIQHYGLLEWDIPKHFLCPAIPGRAEYIHRVADLLDKTNSPVNALEIGVGASCIYPIIGVTEYGWQFVGSDINQEAVISARKIVNQNPNLKGKIDIRSQYNAGNLLKGIIRKNEFYDLVICNPPFHASAKQAKEMAIKKLRNLKRKNTKEAILNFGGQANELWYKGGEFQFLKNLITESVEFSSQVNWCTSLISKKETLNQMVHLLKNSKASDVKVIELNTSNKISRILCWKY